MCCGPPSAARTTVFGRIVRPAPFSSSAANPPTKGANVRNLRTSWAKASAYAGPFSPAGAARLPG